MTGPIKALNLEGLYICNGKYQILNSLGKGYEGETYGLDGPDGSLYVLKVIPFNFSSYRTHCPTWIPLQIDLRKKCPFHQKSTYEADWFKHIDEKESIEIVDMLKWAKRQVGMHRKVQRLRLLSLVPQIHEYGVILIPNNAGNGLMPALYLVMDLVQGHTLSKLMTEIANQHLTYPFMYREPVRSSLSIADSYMKLAEECVESIINRICEHFKHGVSITWDISVDNVMFGYFDSNSETLDFYIVDAEVNITNKSQGIIKETLKDIIDFGRMIMIWDIVGKQALFSQKWSAGKSSEIDFNVYTKKYGRDYPQTFKDRLNQRIQPICENFEI